MEKEIIKIITFFDLFDYPLTSFEIWKYIEKKISLLDFIQYLDASEKIENSHGFYFLLGRKEIIDIRRRRYNYANRKIKIAKRFIFFLKFLPFVKMISLVNSIGERNFRDEGDIDFFIITSEKRIWLTRFVFAGVAAILGSRPSKRKKKDTICLSFYITTKHLNLDDLKLPGYDPYFHYWLYNLIVLYNKDDIYNKFIQANIGHNTKEERNNIIGLFNFLENIVKKIQLIIMPSELQLAANNSEGVVINDDVLKLYLHDHRREFLQKYERKLNEILR